MTLLNPPTPIHLCLCAQAKKETKVPHESKADWANVLQQAYKKKYSLVKMQLSRIKYLSING
jgi:hypothetical protein